MTNEEKLARIAELIEQEIRPYIQADGGDIEIVGLEDNVLKVAMHGACVGCPASIYTLQLGVQRMLQERIDPEITVEDVGAPFM